jgi:hypothetical protein
MKKERDTVLLGENKKQKKDKEDTFDGMMREVRDGVLMTI